MSITQVDNRLKFFPLGLLWGFVAGGFHTYHVLSLGSSDDQVNWLVPIGTIACCSLIALPLGSAMLKRELSTIRWVVNWMITGMASSAGGVAIFYPIFFFGDALLRPTPLALSDPIFFVADLLGGSLIIGLAFSLVVGTVIGIESAAVALLLAPLSLLGRRLILRRRSAVESPSGTFQAQP